MPNIDERVVQMTFDNKQFESGVSESLKTLDDLKKALNFDEVEGSLKNIESAFNNLNLSGLADSVDFIASRFEPLGKIADVALSRIADKALDAGKKVTDAFFGFSDMNGGMEKYATRTKAVQTIMNATGKSLEEVESVLDNLQNYTDETSYDFAAMVSSIGKFTSVGVDLELAEKAMEGIGNEAAKSGASIQEANRAMYNFAQALSTGSVKLIDWRSIANANMATKEFKDVLIETAIELGELKKEGESIGSTAKGTLVDFKNFEDTLSEDWLTSNVLITALNKYSNMQDEFGQKAYEAAQKALTFEDAMQAVKDAVTSGWMDSFGYIFGNLKEAMKLWTDVSNALYEYVAIFADWRNDILESWHTMGGYNDMIEAASNLWQTFMNIVKGVGEALTNVFPVLMPENMSQVLRDGTRSLKEWSADLLEMFGLQEDVKKEEEETAEEAEEVKGKVDDVKESADAAAGSMTDLSDASKEVSKNVNGIETGIKRGMRGDNVKALQQKLVSLGFRLDKFGVDGIFGPETQAAVEELQRALGVEVTGALDEATLAALNTEEGMAKLQERMHKGLSTGDVGKDVRDIQNELNKYLGDSDKLVADGIYGPKTKAAVEKLQKELGVEVTGTWDDTTRAAFESSKMVLFSFEKIRKGIKRGETSNEVKALQEQLIKTGYLTDQSVADGIYGPKTEEAVRKLQRELGVEETGVWDEATYRAAARAKRMKKANLDSAKSAEEAAETVNDASEKNEEASESADKATSHTTVAMMRLQNIVKGWGAALKIVTKFTGAVAEIAGNILGMFSPLVDVAIRFGSVFGSMFENLAKDLDENDTYGSFVKNVTDAFKPFGDFIKNVADGLNGFLDAYDAFLESTGKNNTFGAFFDFLKDYLKKIPAIGFIIDVFNTVKSAVGPIISFLIEQLQNLIGWFGSDDFKQAKDSVFSWISEKLTSLREAIAKFKEDHPELTIENFIAKIKEIGSWVGGKFGEGIENVKGKFTEFKTIIDKFKQDHPELTISNIFQKIKDAFKAIGEMLSGFFVPSQQSESGTFFDELKARFKAFEPVLNWIEGIKDRIVKLWQSIFGGGDEAKTDSGIIETVKAQVTSFDSLKDKMNGIQSAVDWFVSLKDKLVSAWNDLVGIGSNGGPDLAQEGGFTSVFDKLGEFSKEIANVDLGKVISTALKALAVYSLLNISSGIKNIGKGSKSLGEGLSGAVKSLFASFSNIANKVAKNFDFKGLSKALSERIKYGKQDKESIGTKALKIAGSILMIVAAIAIVTKVVKDNNQKDVDKALWIVGGIIVALGTISILMSAFSKGSKNNTTGILALCAGIFVIALAIEKVLGILTGDKSSMIPKALWIVGGALVALGIIAVLISAFSKNDSSGIKGILSLCIGIFVLVLALEKTIKVITNVDKNTLDKALWIVGGAVALVGIIGVLISAFSKNDSSGVKGLASLCTGIYVLVLALEKMISIVLNTKEKTLKTAVGIIGGMVIVLGTISILTAALSKNKKTKTGGFKSLVLGLSAMVTLLSIIIGIVDKTNPNSLDKALWIMGGMFVALTAFLAASYFIGSGDNGKRSKSMLKGAATMAGALGIIVAAATILVGGLGELARIESLDLIGSMRRGKEILSIVADTFAAFKEKLGVNWLTIAGFLAASWLIGYFDKVPTSMIEGAAAISAALSIVVSAAVVLIGGLGELDRLEALDLKGSIQRGQDILIIVANTLSTFKEKLGLTLPVIGGVLLASILVGLIPTGPTSMIEGALAIGGALDILAFAAALLITGIGALDEVLEADLVSATETGGKILESIASTLSSFGEKLGLSLPIIAGILAASLIVGIIPGGAGALELGAIAISAAASTIIGVLTTLVTGLGVLNDWTGKGLESAIDSGAGVLESISAAIARVKSGFTKVYNEDLKDFGEAMTRVREGVEGVSSDGSLDSDMTVATDMVSKLYEFFNSLTSYSLVDAPGVVTEYTSTASLLLDDVSSFGKAISDLWNGVTGISADKAIDSDVDTSISVVTTLKTKFFDVIGNSDTLPDGSGLITYNSKISSIIEHVKTFGESIGTFHTNTSRISSSAIESDTTTAINVATQIAGFLESLGSLNIETKHSGILGWFETETTGETVFESIKKLGESISGSQDSFSGISASNLVSDVTAATSVAESVAKLLSYLGSGDVYSNITAGAQGLDALSSMFNDSDFSLATIIKDFATQMGSIDNLPEVSNIFSGFGLLAGSISSNETVKNSFSDSGKALAVQLVMALASELSSSENTQKVTTAEIGMINSVVSVLEAMKFEFEYLGRMMDQGIANGLSQSASIVTDMAKEVALSAYIAAKKSLEIASPSKKFMWLGNMTGEGLVKGIESYSKIVSDTSADVAEGAVNSAKNGISLLSEILKFGDIDDQPVIRPVVDLTNIHDANDEMIKFYDTAFGRLPMSTVIAKQIAADIDMSKKPSNHDTGSLSAGSGGSLRGGVDSAINDAVNGKLWTGSIAELGYKFDRLAERMANMQVVLDTGEFVGATSSAYDKQFGRMTGRRERGN